MLKNHREETRNRYEKEMVIVYVVVGYVLMYACVVLFTRGFV
jgi:hypothetical protein